MKKVFAVFFCVLLAAVPVGASANSGPAYWQHTPSFSIAPLKDCPVTVSREDLSFDFSAEKNLDYGPQAQVTASYQMKNPTAKPVKVQMAFPLIASLNDLAQIDGVHISANSKNIPFEIYLGGKQPDAGVNKNYYDADGKLIKTSLPSFSQILKSVNAKPTARKIIKGSGKLYKMTSSKQCGVKVSVPLQNSYIFNTGFNGFSRSNDTISVFSSPYKDQDLSLLVLGGQNPNIETFQDQNLTKKATQGVNVQVSNIDVETYLKDMFSGSPIYKAYPSDGLLKSLISEFEDEADAAMAINPSFGDADFSSFFEQEHIVVLCYEAEFPANGTQNITVSYPMGGAMNVEKTHDPVYSYGYLLNPAKGWAGFQNLNIKVVPPKREPYVVSSSIPLTAEKDGAYTAKLSSLPQNDFVFSIHSESKTEPKDSSIFSWNPTVILITVVIIVLIAVMIAAGRLKGRE
ncbi:MAG TPA: hypothetical protein VHP31_08585 [Caproicibacter sp.]|nr:hypothetical protein [Caproicibacter sp.]